MKRDLALKIDFVTLFPDMVLDAIRQGVLRIAEYKEIIAFASVDPREFAEDVHRTVDDRPFGGAPGMLLRCRELDLALKSMELASSDAVVFFEPSGQPFTQKIASELSLRQRLVLVAGRYEGIDQRIVDRYATHVLSVGDYILTGGELPALIVADAVSRLIDGVLGDQQSLAEDSHSDGLLSYPQYTRPQCYEGMDAPEVLLSGDHRAIDQWRRQQQLQITRKQRPDLFCTAPLSLDDLELL